MKFPATALFAAFVSNNNHPHSNNNNNNNVWRNQKGTDSKKNIEFGSSRVSSSSSSSLSLFPFFLNDPTTPTTTIRKEDIVQVLSLQDVPVIEVNMKSLSHQSSKSNDNNNNLRQSIMDWFQDTVGVPPAYAASQSAAPPTKDEIQTLRQAFAAFYGANRDATAAERLLTQSIEAWQRQPPDEQAGLYRVRGDCYMALLRAQDAIKDYSQAISLIQGPGGEKADPAELPASLLGRARAYRSLHSGVTKEEAQQEAADYFQALKLSSREEWDTEEELLEDGARTNPYATWEYGMALRLVGDYSKAQSVHTLASDYFDDIGDKARSVISAIDAGIDAAAMVTNDNASSADTAKAILKNAIQRTKTVEGRDIPLLQRVIAKEGEGRLALASVLWVSGEKPDAESQLGLACQRLDQLEADAIARNKINPPIQGPPRLKFNIDDGVGALDINCSILKNKDYQTQRLEWPVSLQEQAEKLNKLR